MSASERARADARRGGTEKLVGAQLLTHLDNTGQGEWRGRLFVPDIDKRSKAKLQLVAPDQPKVSGCLAGRVICKSQTWTRAKGPAD